MDTFKTIKPDTIEQAKKIVSVCLNNCVHSIDDVANRIMEGEYFVAMSPTGFWIFSKRDKEMVVEGCQGIHLCNSTHLKEIQEIAKRNDCERLSFFTKLPQLAFIGKRLGFFELPTDSGFYMVIYVN